MVIFKNELSNYHRWKYIFPSQQGTDVKNPTIDYPAPSPQTYKSLECCLPASMIPPLLIFCSDKSQKKKRFQKLKENKNFLSYKTWNNGPTISSEIFSIFYVPVSPACLCDYGLCSKSKFSKHAVLMGRRWHSCECCTNSRGCFMCNRDVVHANVWYWPRVICRVKSRWPNGRICRTNILTWQISLFFKAKWLLSWFCICVPRIALYLTLPMGPYHSSIFSIYTYMYTALADLSTHGPLVGEVSKVRVGPHMKWLEYTF